MEIFSEFITPAELTGFARAGLDDPQNRRTLSTWFPLNLIDDLNYRFSSGGMGLAEAAMYRALDAEPAFGARRPIKETTGKLPPIGEQLVLGEYDQYRLRANPGQAIRDLLLRDAERIARAIDTRMEFARAEALVNATVTLAENGVQATVEFDRNPEHSVAPAVLWTDTTNAVPIDDMQSWRDTYVDSTGASPGTILGANRIRNLLVQNAQIRNQLYPSSPPTRVTFDDLDSLLANFDLPPFTTYDARAIDTTGLRRRYIPDDRLLFLPAPSEAEGMGATLYGTTLESLEPQYGIADTEQPGIVVAAFKQSTTPVRVLTIGAALALPILGEPDLTFVADVA